MLLRAYIRLSAHFLLYLCFAVAAAGDLAVPTLKPVNASLVTAAVRRHGELPRPIPGHQEHLRSPRRGRYPIFTLPVTEL